MTLYRDKLECSMASPARLRREPPVGVNVEPTPMTVGVLAMAALVLRRNFFPRP